VLEFANVELIEMRWLDDRLDEALDEAAIRFNKRRCKETRAAAQKKTNAIINNAVGLQNLVQENAEMADRVNAENERLRVVIAENAEKANAENERLRAVIADFEGRTD
jgi:hypothetical protein